MQAAVKSGSVIFVEDETAPELAAPSDVVVLCGEAHSEEGWDRQSFKLFTSETSTFGSEGVETKDTVKALREAGHKNLVLVAFVPGAVHTDDWIESVDAALMLFMPGEMAGIAVASLLTGSASPGGRLPVSFPKTGEKRFTERQYPGVQPHGPKWGKHLLANFSEGVLVGYRWNDAMEKPSAFPFGFGLTYTDFKFSGFKASCGEGVATVSVKVTNIGGRGSFAVPQVYVGFASLKPVVRQLKGFQKVWIKKNQSETVKFLLGPDAWRFYDESAKRWESAGLLGEQITVSVGSSSGHLDWSHALSCGNNAFVDNNNEMIA
jgi:beta-glucosidase